jgi:hypothetical protein
VSWHLAQNVLEVRYQGGFLNWDRAGRIANELLSQYPSLEVEDGNPSNVTIAGKKEQVAFAYGLNASRATANSSRNGSDHLEAFAPGFFSIVLRNLEVKTLTRVGHRANHHFKCSSLADAETKLVEFATRQNAGAQLLKSIDDSRLQNKTLRRLSLRFEDDKTGFTVLVQTHEIVPEISGPNADLLRDHLPPPEFLLGCDIDIFTKQPLSVGDFVVPDLIKSNLKMIRTRLLPLISS